MHRGTFPAASLLASSIDVRFHEPRASLIFLFFLFSSLCVFLSAEVVPFLSFLLFFSRGPVLSPPPSGRRAWGRMSRFFPRFFCARDLFFRHVARREQMRCRFFFHARRGLSLPVTTNDRPVISAVTAFRREGSVPPPPFRHRSRPDLVKVSWFDSSDYSLTCKIHLSPPPAWHVRFLSLDLRRAIRIARNQRVSPPASFLQINSGAKVWIKLQANLHFSS